MIRTQDLVGFLKTTRIYNVDFKHCYNLNEIKEYRAEIIKRLKELDEIKSGKIK